MGSRTGSSAQAWSEPAGAPRWLTMALLATFVAAFMLEQYVARRTGHAGVDTVVLVSTGGVSRHLVFSGEVYRLLSAPFLHASSSHLIANGIAFFLVASTLERLLGPAAVFCVFALGGLAGTIASVALNAPNVVSVGASGAIMALLMTLLLASLGMPEGRDRTRVQIRSIWIMLTAVLPTHGGPVHVDYAAHFGGALFGAGYGLLLLHVARTGGISQADEEREQATAAIAACAVVLSFCAVTWRYPTYAALSMLIPPGQLPHGQAGIFADADALLARYPNDPRSHVFKAAALLKRDDKSGGERELRTALALAEGPGGLFRHSFTNLVRATLAETLVEDGRGAEAARIAEVPCTAHGDEAPPPQLRSMLERKGLCAAAARL